MTEAEVCAIEEGFEGEGGSVRYLDLLHHVMPRGCGELWRHEEKLR